MSSSSISEGSRKRQELIDDLLERTSRTFALAIPLLPEPTRQEVKIAYLLFRIADTFEDAGVHWQRNRQLEALEEFAAILENYARADVTDLAHSWLEPPPSSHQGYIDLLKETPAVLEAWQDLSRAARDVLGKDTIRTADGMAGFVRRTGPDHVLRLDNIPELQAYCYVVAGIVGEMLTDLFLLNRDNLAPLTAFLSERAAKFGEALQLVNILKDSASDATEGRVYVPENLDRSKVFDLARQDLAAAAEYSLAIQEAGGPGGIVAFTALPVELAWATLDRVEEKGAGAKLSRAEVYFLDRRVKKAIAANRPAVSRLA
ncbi:MAG: squalene/phytoene synthase family protein [Thermoanaerobaculia bacterium]